MKEANEIQISIMDILRALLNKWWIIFFTSVICATAFFCYVYAFVQQQYTASAKMYVNNTSISVGSSKVQLSYADITANRSLVDSYAVILTTRLTLEEVLDKSNLSDKYTYGQIRSMVSVSAVNSTEIFSVSVTCADPNDAKTLANTILAVFPSQISEIIEGSSAKVVDYAVGATAVSRGLTQKALIGFLFGFVVSAGLILLFDIFINDAIESLDWVKNTLGEDVPLLSVIPDTSEHKHGYYGKYYKGYYKNYYNRYYYQNNYYTSKSQNKDDSNK